MNRNKGARTYGPRRRYSYYVRACGYSARNPVREIIKIGEISTRAGSYELFKKVVVGVAV